MKKVITYGTYDLLHQGHINLLRRAKELGDYLIVGVTSDSFDRGRGKLNVRNNVLERVEAVKATGYADKIIIEDYVGQKIDDIQKYNVDIFAIGSDWEGLFDYLNEFTKVVYLPRTQGISSTMLRAESTTDVRVGIVGCGRIAKRFPLEADVVNGIIITAAFDTDMGAMVDFTRAFKDVKACGTFENMLENVDTLRAVLKEELEAKKVRAFTTNGVRIPNELVKEFKQLYIFDYDSEKGYIVKDTKDGVEVSKL